ncbi:MAG: MBL fold metallo-hydrolase [Armatimonadetes bacterium]|nr:MBL fold metallo-hydrolase [Armatimonadota bacterium]
MKIIAYSSAMFSTWIFSDPYQVMFDAGDGVTAMLQHKIRRIRTIVMTHAHRDHLGGLLQLLNLRGGWGALDVYYPEGSGAFIALKEFTARFDALTAGTVGWHPVGIGSEIPLPGKRDVFLRTFPTRHYPESDSRAVRTLGYHLIERRMKLKEAFRGLPQEEIDALRRRDGKDFVLEEVESRLLSVTGDTGPLDAGIFQDSRLLFHETTFLLPKDQAETGERAHEHSNLPHVLALARDAGVKSLVLYHISTRYKPDEIREAARETAAAVGLSIPIRILMPGILTWDMMAEPDIASP